MNVTRVFLQNLLLVHTEGKKNGNKYYYRDNISNTYIEVTDKQKIEVLFIIFDEYLASLAAK